MSGSKPQVSVSIATIPSRIAHIRPTLESLLNGKLVPDQILVVRPVYCGLENSGYVVPGFLLDPSFCGGIIKLVQCTFDWGPGNKLLGALDHLPANSFLILADDDVRYKPNFLADLMDFQRQELNFSFSFYAYRCGGVTIGQGCDGFSFWSPNLTGIDIFAKHFVRGTTLMYHDDLWISFYLAMRGVSIKGLQSRLDGGLVYEQLLPNTALSTLSGDKKREEICRVHIPRLLKESALRADRKMRVRMTASLDGIQALQIRATRKLGKLVAASCAQFA